MRKIRPLLALTIVVSMLLLPIKIFAEEPTIEEPEVIEEIIPSEWTKFYEEKIRQNILTFVLSYFGGNVSVGVALALVFKKIKKRADKAIDNMNINSETKEALKEYNEKMLDKMENITNNKLEPYIQKVDNMTQTIFTLLEENKTLTDLVETLSKKLEVENAKIAKILEIAFTNDPNLVRNGFATAIKKELGYEI